ncbi:MAG: 16S rRNA (guanine(527)-N(7))-methyltransferase RsmG [Candidatus Muiribacteriota bacterium]|jgi:16S rRNA (guanine527-N7)-methyltransferase
MNFESAEKLFEKHNISIKKQSLEKILNFYNFMLEENKKYNIASIKDESVFFEKNIVDSLIITKVLDKIEGNLIDIGSGNGLPGLILKSAFPDLDVTLIDAEMKKIKFLQQAVKLFFDNVKIIHGRAEDYFKKSKVKFDFVTAKALVSKPEKWVRWTVPFVNPGGIVINYKTKKFLEELSLPEVKSYIESRNISLYKTYDYCIEESERTLVLLKKRGKNEI